jgi:hypothetical protein
MSDSNAVDLEKTTEAGFIVLIALAAQTRDGKVGDPSEGDLVAAKMLFNKAFREVTG